MKQFCSLTVKIVDLNKQSESHTAAQNTISLLDRVSGRPPFSISCRKTHINSLVAQQEDLHWTAVSSKADTSREGAILNEKIQGIQGSVTLLNYSIFITCREALSFPAAHPTHAKRREPNGTARRVHTTRHELQFVRKWDAAIYKKLSHIQGSNRPGRNAWKGKKKTKTATERSPESSSSVAREHLP